MPKALKNAPGLSCKACQTGSSHHLGSSFYSKSEERTTYTVLGLLSHFRSQHLPYQQHMPGHGIPVAPLDWKEDMIELPSERFISGLIHAPGMDDEKLLMIATVFPSLFPMPLPKIGVIDSHGLASPASSGPKDTDKTPGAVDVPGETIARPSSVMNAAEVNLSLPPKPLEAGYEPVRPTLAGESNEASGSTNRKRSYRQSPPVERRQHHYDEPRYYVGDIQYSTGLSMGLTCFSVRCPGIILMMAIIVRGNTWSTRLVLGSSMRVLRMTTILVAGQLSASKSDSMDLPKMWSMRIRGKGVTAVGNTVRIPARFDTTKKTIIGPNIGS